MTERRTDDPPRHTPDALPAATPAPLPPEADQPRDLDDDSAGGGGRIPLPKEGGGDPADRRP